MPRPTSQNQPRTGFLTPLAVKLLHELAAREHEEDGELVHEGRQWWLGPNRVSGKAATELIVLALVRNSANRHDLERWVVNEEGRRLLADPAYVPLLVQALRKRRGLAVRPRTAQAEAIRNILRDAIGDRQAYLEACHGKDPATAEQLTRYAALELRLKRQARVTLTAPVTEILREALPYALLWRESLAHSHPKGSKARAAATRDAAELQGLHVRWFGEPCHSYFGGQPVSRVSGKTVPPAELVKRPAES